MKACTPIMSSSPPASLNMARRGSPWLPSRTGSPTGRKKKTPIRLPRLSHTFTSPRFICSKTSPAMFPLLTFGDRRTVASPSMGLYPRVSRNTFSNRAYTGISNEIGILARGRPPRRRSRTRKESRGHHCAGPHGGRRVHELLYRLHGLQHAASPSHLHRNRGPTP